MGFKSMEQFNEERYGNFLTLANDNDYADVIFLYRSKADVLMADVHYIKSAEYSGYAHCCGVGCPACAFPTKSGKGLRVDSKLFIPLYNLTANKIQFWDRSTRFDVQLANDVFNKFPNPSEFVFRITRHGAAFDRDTRYEIQAVGKNTSMPYEKILADFNIKLPDYYSTVVKDLSIAEMSSMLNSTNDSGMSAIPREAYVPAPSMTISPADIVGEYGAPVAIADLPGEIPVVADTTPEVTAVPEVPADLKLPDAFAGDIVPAPEVVAGPEAEATSEDVDNVQF